MKILSRGAEADIYIHDNMIIKERVKKNYRIDKLDYKLRKFRTKREFKVITKLFEGGVNVPRPLENDLENMRIFMEFIEGKPLKSTIDRSLLFKFFNEIIKMHSIGIVHGDLTTLNCIVKNNKTFIIDFGLSKFSTKIEDRAEDLHLFFVNLKNEHSDLYHFRSNLEKIYEEKIENGKKVINRVKDIQLRGRNKKRK